MFKSPKAAVWWSLETLNRWGSAPSLLPKKEYIPGTGHLVDIPARVLLALSVMVIFDRVEHRGILKQHYLFHRPPQDWPPHQQPEVWRVLTEFGTQLRERKLLVPKEEKYGKDHGPGRE